MEDFIDYLIGGFIIGILIVILIWVTWWVINVPMSIAKKRGLAGGELATISILSWCGLIFLITWFIALGLALFWDNGKWVSNQPKESELDRLEKAHKLMEKGVITKKEYEKMRKELL